MSNLATDIVHSEVDCKHSLLLFIFPSTPFYYHFALALNNSLCVSGTHLIITCSIVIFDLLSNFPGSIV